STPRKRRNPRVRKTEARRTGFKPAYFFLSSLALLARDLFFDLLAGVEEGAAPDLLVVQLAGMHEPRVEVRAAVARDLVQHLERGRLVLGVGPCLLDALHEHRIRQRVSRLHHAR